MKLKRTNKRKEKVRKISQKEMKGKINAATKGDTGLIAQVRFQCIDCQLPHTPIHE
jgi:hypothetical protein